MDPIASFKAALLQARAAELSARAECLTELEDITAQKKFAKDLGEALEKLRAEDVIPADPLTEFLGQCAQVVGWQIKLTEQESYFAARLHDGFKTIDRLIADGLPADEWAAVQEDITGMEAEFTASREQWQDSLPTELWPVVEEAERAETLGKLDSILQHARDTSKLTEEIGWNFWRLTRDNSGPALGDNEVDIPASCSGCGHEWVLGFGFAGKTVNCPECAHDVKLPAAIKAKRDAEARAAEKIQPPVQVPGVPEEKHSGLPAGWKDHFDSDPEAQARVAARPFFDVEELQRLNAKAVEVAERTADWQKYFPRMTATHLPFDSAKAWDLIVRDPGEVVGELTSYWPESDWALSPRVARLLGSGEMDIAQGVALLSTDKERLERQTVREIRERVEANPANSLLSPSDYLWLCSEAEKVKLVYTDKLEKKCAGLNWKHNFEVDEELETAFAEGLSVADGLGELLKGKSRKQEISAKDVATVFDQMRRINEINGDLYSDDGSTLRDVAELPHDWRFHFWEPAQFESEKWIKANPIVAVRLLTSELPQIVAEFTGRETLFGWREKSLALLEDEELSVQQKAMILPVMIGITDQLLFISEEAGSGEVVNPGQKPGPLKIEIDRSFRSSEIRALLDGEFPQKVADYTEQSWILDTMESQAHTRREGMAWGAKIGIGIAALIVLSLIYTFISERIRSGRSDTAMAEAEARSLMVAQYTLDFSLVPTNITASNIVVKVDGSPSRPTDKLEEGEHTFVIDHPALKTVRKPFSIAYGTGTNFGQITLEPAVGSLSISSDPAGASIALNGGIVGDTPYTAKGLAAGPNKITITSPKFGTWTTNAEIAKDQTLTINYRFGRGTVKVETTPAGFYIATGPAGTPAAQLTWDAETKTTPAELQMLPGEYVVSLAHPSMGSVDAIPFTVEDQQQAALSKDFTVAAANISPGPDAQFWRGSYSMGAWMNWEPGWKFSTASPLTLFRLWKPGRYPVVHSLAYRGGGFSSRVKDPLAQGGKVECWGSDSRKQTTVPSHLESRKFIDIAAGANHTVGLLDDMSVVCWGDNRAGQSTVPENLGPCMMVAAGANHTVALQIDGKIACWGANQNGQCTVPDNFPSCVAISAAGNRTVALLADGSLRGLGYGGFTLKPTSHWRPFIEVSAGAFYITTLTDLGEPAIHVQTASGVAPQVDLTTSVQEEGRYVAVTGGTGHMIWLTSDGKLITAGKERNIPAIPQAGPYLVVNGAFERQAAVNSQGETIIWGRKTGISSRMGFERVTEADTKVNYWKKTGNYLRVECGEKHYVALRR
jgi:hypothetical protein